MRLILFFIFMMNVSLFAQAAVHLKFTDLQNFLETGPRGRLLLSQRDADMASARADLQWRNPELEAEHESLRADGEHDTESSILMHKSFMSPWAGAAHKKARILDMQASELETQQQQLSLLADWKYMYVQLQLKRALQERLRLFQNSIQDVSDISKRRHEQGTTSGLNDALLQMSVFDIKATMLHLNSDIRRLENTLKTELGLSADRTLILASDIIFQPVDVSHVRINETVAASPKLQSAERRMSSSKNRLRFEQGNVLPEFSLSGGYKQVNNDFKGAVVGVSLPLPLLSLNRGAVQKAQAELTLTSIDFDLKKAELVNTIQEVSLLVEESQLLLDEYSVLFDRSDVMSNLVFSFKEGWISLTDLFSGVEVYAGAIESYYAHLLHYYENIFQLEALTTETLIRF